ncbi:hypothetical protein ALP8811_00402 [Aliiroseovarius pelagivivens]|uniref:Uncharacterized protein n=1 Tax=Aliiroseovarius pelagivivens TaxID=1639690 RepID=A0A2R8AHB5_9RHOB|nr:hypothetical protein [Aliiroseovarius pelagivivens]SPF75415.1 hypothetical protein ALP8811_00402 [Aliiroseovarius pelagivivens]
MPSITCLKSEKTNLGLVRAQGKVSGVNISPNSVSVVKKKFDPQLPKGMSVQNCTAFVLAVSGPVQIENLEFRISIDSPIEGTPCTGQCLDAQEWSSEDYTIVIGTEDAEILSDRLGAPELEDRAVVDYDKNSLTLRLERLVKRDGYSFHFLMVENPVPEPVDASAWFAVDQSHKNVLRS